MRPLRATAALACVFILSSLPVGHIEAAEVSFKQAFQAAAGLDVVVVSVHDDDVLVFEPGSYYTEGRNLVIRAARARLEAGVSLEFFSPDSRPPVIPGVAATGDAGRPGDNFNCSRSGCRGENGKPGKAGSTGSQGAPGGSMFIDIQHLSGSGFLSLVPKGQNGGRGQRGGQGGTGGRGGDGAKRSCGPVGDTRAGPGDGGEGGTGGPGGKGGTGGAGGAGGTVTVSAALAALGESEMFTIWDQLRAEGGPGGEPGAKGQGGPGGGMGRGNTCGGGGRNGANGNEGSPGSWGEWGSWGTHGLRRIEARP